MITVKVVCFIEFTWLWAVVRDYITMQQVFFKMQNWFLQIIRKLLRDASGCLLVTFVSKQFLVGGDDLFIPKACWGFMSHRDGFIWFDFRQQSQKWNIKKKKNNFFPYIFEWRIKLPLFHTKSLLPDCLWTKIINSTAHRSVLFLWFVQDWFY